MHPRCGPGGWSGASPRSCRLRGAEAGVAARACAFAPSAPRPAAVSTATGPGLLAGGQCDWAGGVGVPLFTRQGVCDSSMPLQTRSVSPSLLNVGLGGEGGVP